MEVVKLNAISKKNHGKIAAKKTRDSGWLPCAIHGHQNGTQHVAVDYKTFADTVNKQGELVPFALTLDGKENAYSVLVKEVQKDRIRAMAIHCDFQLVTDKPVSVAVPLRTIGTPAGARGGGVLQTMLRKIRVSCPIEKIPQVFELDITPLEIGNGFKIQTLIDRYPEIHFLHNPLTTIVTLAAKTQVVVKTETVEGATAEGAEGAVPADGKEPEKGKTEAGGDKAEKKGGKEG